ncbi:MAG: pilus assembly protein PilP [Persicimonas sp.]
MAGRSSVCWSLLLTLLLALGTVSLGACQPEVADGTTDENQDSPDEGDGDKPAKPSAEEAKEKAEAEEEEEEEYERPDYPASVRRNPFQPDREVLEPQRDLDDEEEERPRDPLEKYGLGELDLVVIISEVAVPKAMFIDPEGFGHVLAEGDRIGSGGGVVADIRDNEVDVQESSDDEDSNVTTIELRDRELTEDDDEDLSEEERESLKRLLQSEDGRRALEESEEQGNRRQQERPTDERFGNIEPADDE